VLQSVADSGNDEALESGMISRAIAFAVAVHCSALRHSALQCVVGGLSHSPSGTGDSEPRNVCVF